MESFIGQALNQHISLTFLWLDVCHMASFNCMGSWKMLPSYGPRKEGKMGLGERLEIATLCLFSVWYLCILIIKFLFFLNLSWLLLCLSAWSIFIIAIFKIVEDINTDYFLRKVGSISTYDASSPATLRWPDPWGSFPEVSPRRGICKGQRIRWRHWRRR